MLNRKINEDSRLNFLVLSHVYKFVKCETYTALKLICIIIIGFNSHFVTAKTVVKILSWNLKDFGQSKGVDQIVFAAYIMKSYDIVSVQEVVAGPGGSQAIAKLVAELNRTGSQWEYSISGPTSGSSAFKVEKYAFIWNRSRVKLMRKCWLESKYGELIEREPYYGRFKINDHQLTVVNFHAVPKSKQPETEIKYFKLLPSSYPNDNLVFCGDFNLPQSHSVFGPLKKAGYRSVFVDQKTSLRQKCINGDCLASELDNCFYNSKKISVVTSMVIHFYKAFPDIKVARKLSDHLPIAFVLSFIDN